MSAFGDIPPGRGGGGVVLELFPDKGVPLETKNSYPFTENKNQCVKF